MVRPPKSSPDVRKGVFKAFSRRVITAEMAYFFKYEKAIPQSMKRPLRNPRQFCDCLDKYGDNGFMQRYNHPFLVGILEEPRPLPITADTTARLERVATLAPRKCYCIPLVREKDRAGKPWSIGRSGLCDITATLSALSGFHALIGTRRALNPETEHRPYDDRRYQLRDLGSTNGTKLNGNYIPPHNNVDLSSGDLIECHPQLRLRFVQGEHTVEFLRQYRELF
ncbi:FHA domain-containing protein [Candidatus Woesearchaeota archaeon]|nr:FHA domain-containing protein [Candidatus Woesearchaeota archaeon]